MTLNEIMSTPRGIAYLQSARTLSAAEVDHNEHRKDMGDLGGDYSPEDRAAFDTGSMHRVRI